MLPVRMTQYQIGMMYLNGEDGVRKDLEQAEFWLANAEAAGSNDARQELIMLKLNNSGE